MEKARILNYVEGGNRINYRIRTAPLHSNEHFHSMVEDYENVAYWIISEGNARVQKKQGGEIHQTTHLGLQKRDGNAGEGITTRLSGILLYSHAIQMQFIALCIFQTSSSEFIVITVQSSRGLLAEVAKLQIRILQAGFLRCNEDPVSVKMSGRSVTPTVYIIHKVPFQRARLMGPWWIMTPVVQHYVVTNISGTTKCVLTQGTEYS